MCQWSSRDYEHRLGADPSRSFFEALRDLFRRRERRQPEGEVEAEVVLLPARGVVREAARAPEPDRPGAA